MRNTHLNMYMNGYAYVTLFSDNEKLGSHHPQYISLFDPYHPYAALPFTTISISPFPQPPL